LEKKEHEMAKVVFDITSSLDGFVAGPNDSPDLPMGEGGLRLFDWYFSESETSRSPEDIDPEIREEAAQAVGAIVSGRRTYDQAHGWNGEHPLHVPVFVVTHQPPENVGEFNGAFITDGVESAIKQAQAAAGHKAVALNSPDIARQALQSGLLDELSIHIVPVLIGGGVRLFDHLGTEHIELECTQATNARKVIHMTFRVIK
jgi:dihydrofolate reductase